MSASRSKYWSKGWWKWQLSKLFNAPSRIWGYIVAAYRARFPKKLSDEEQWEAWQKHLERVHLYITEVFRHRLIFNEITAMLQGHPTLATSTDAGYVYDWLRDLYAHYVTMAVRREIDRDANVVNLRRLLWEISRRPKVLSRERYLRHFAGLQDQKRWDSNFTEIAGRGSYIDAKIVKKDLNDLEDEAAAVKRYANKVVAHQTGEEATATIRDVNRALEHISQLLQKYYALFTGNSLAGAEPTILVPWRRAFRVPWV